MQLHLEQGFSNIVSPQLVLQPGLGSLAIIKPHKLYMYGRDQVYLFILCCLPFCFLPSHCHRSSVAVGRDGKPLLLSVTGAVLLQTELAPECQLPHTLLFDF